MDNEKQELYQFENLIQDYIDNKYSCCDDFIHPDTVSGLLNNIQKLRAAGQMQPAGIGKKKDFQMNALVRGDLIKWIEENSEDPFESYYLQKIWRFINHLNATCYTSIKGFESHYASYEQNSFYKKHLDQFKNDSQRKFSIVLYLNKDWQQEDGGTLSLYPEGSEQKDISPIGGRMAFFKSDEMEHEVHPSFTRDRISIAGWLKS